MLNANNKEKNDIEKCREELKAILDKYNCFMIDRDESMRLILVDADTKEQITFR